MLPRLLLLLCLLPATPGLATTDAGASPRTSITIPFLSTRELRPGADNGSRFSNDIGDLSAGECEVLLPDEATSRAVNGQISSRSADEVLGRFQGLSPGGILVYIHGYNIGLARACRDAARLARVTNHGNRTLLFSWPASEAVLTYPRDERRFAQSVPQIISSLHELGKRYGYENINIVAHSMGSRVALAMEDPGAGSPPPREQRFNKLILVASDIDREAFLRVQAGLKKQVQQLTLLVSDRDRLLLLSQILHLQERLGQADDLTLDGIEIIDVSTLDDLGMVGHVYHLDSDRVGGLLRDILSSDSLPSRP